MANSDTFACPCVVCKPLGQTIKAECVCCRQSLQLDHLGRCQEGMIRYGMTGQWTGKHINCRVTEQERQEGVTHKYNSSWCDKCSPNEANAAAADGKLKPDSPKRKAENEPEQEPSSESKPPTMSKEGEIQQPGSGPSPDPSAESVPQKPAKRPKAAAPIPKDQDEAMADVKQLESVFETWLVKIDPKTQDFYYAGRIKEAKARNSRAAAEQMLTLDRAVLADRQAGGGGGGAAMNSQFVVVQSDFYILEVYRSMTYGLGHVLTFHTTSPIDTGLVSTWVHQLAKLAVHL